MPLLRLLIPCLSLLLFSCSFNSPSVITQNRTKQYLSAKSIPPLKIPPGLTSDAFQNYYPVSDKNYPDSAKNISLTPPGLYENNS